MATTRSTSRVNRTSARTETNETADQCETAAQPYQVAVFSVGCALSGPQVSKMQCVLLERLGLHDGITVPCV